MARRRRGRPIHGWLNIDKPVGMSSAACVAAVKRITGAAKAGHAGTLDPAASGVLPVALGEATKTAAYLMSAEKSYRFTVRWGVESDTDDAAGSITGESAVRPAIDAMRAALHAFEGEILQAPPAVSAIKVDGKRAYAHAREGAPLALAPRPVRVLRLTHEARLDGDHDVFMLICGKGVYVRAIARDLGRSLGTCALVAALRRLAVGRFHADDAISLEKLEEFGHSAAGNLPLCPIETALDDIPALLVSAQEAVMLRNGQAVPINAVPVGAARDRARLRAAGGDHEGVVLVRDARAPVALARVDGPMIRPMRVLNL